MRIGRHGGVGQPSTGPSSAQSTQREPEVSTALLRAYMGFVQGFKQLSHVPHTHGELLPMLEPYWRHIHELFQQLLMGTPS